MCVSARLKSENTAQPSPQNFVSKLFIPILPEFPIINPTKNENAENNRRKEYGVCYVILQHTGENIYVIYLLRASRADSALIYSTCNRLRKQTHVLKNIMASNESRHKKEPKIHFLKLAFKDAKQMSQRKHSCLEEVKHTMNISLAPKFIGNLKLGLKEEMNKFLFVYQTKLNGVPLAYDRIQITKSKIIDDQEFLNLEICVNFIVFQPEISKILRGCVNKLGINLLFKFCFSQNFILYILLHR